MTTVPNSHALGVCFALLAACGPEASNTTTPTQPAATSTTPAEPDAQTPEAASAPEPETPSPATANAATVPGIGQPTPPFSLPDADGTLVSLASLLASGPTVVVFYRGDW